MQWFTPCGQDTHGSTSLPYALEPSKLASGHLRYLRVGYWNHGPFSFDMFRWSTKKTRINTCYHSYIGLQHGRVNHVHQCPAVPSGKLTYLWKITIFNGKTHYKLPFSIVMLVYQRVNQIMKRFLSKLILPGQPKGRILAVIADSFAFSTMTFCCIANIVVSTAGYVIHDISFVHILEHML